MNLKLFPLLLLTLAGCRQNTSAAQQAQQDMIVAPTPQTQSETALHRYLARPETAYGWKNAPAGEFAPGDGNFNLKLTSQTWQGTPWTHRLQIFKPATLLHPDAALLNISYGSGSIPETIIGQQLANATGAFVVNVFNVPNQPLFGKSEDELIAYSFGKYLETGDDNWPLLFPMTKAVTKAMDALQEWSQKQSGTKITRFIVSGASKRGWTTDLVAANDARVVGAVPIVYNNLNLPAQIAHQKEIWGETSPLAAPYADMGLFDQMNSERGKKLIEMVDPWSYRAHLTMPKYLINATNDGYWPHDAFRFYRVGLPGEIDQFNVPNAPHTLGDNITAVVGSAAAWSRLILDGKTAPKVGFNIADSAEGRTFSVSTDGAPQNVKLWLASSPSADFRRATWNSMPLKLQGGSYRVFVPNATLWPQGTQFAAAFGEIEIPSQPLPLRLSSEMWQSAEETGNIRRRAWR